MSAEPFRLLVTGSRKFTDDFLGVQALGRLRPPGRRLIVVHGGHEDPGKNPPGFDRIAQDWALELKATGENADQEAHPADWYGPCRPECDHGPRKMRGDRSYCPAAGPYRNREMIEAGAHQALVGLVRTAKNRGTRDCLKQIRIAGIPFALIIQP